MKVIAVMIDRGEVGCSFDWIEAPATPQEIADLAIGAIEDFGLEEIEALTVREFDVPEPRFNRGPGFLLWLVMKADWTSQVKKEES